MTEPREIRWFDISDKFFGRYIQPMPWNEEYRLKLHNHVYPNGDYVYLALPADHKQLGMFLRRVADAEGIDLSDDGIDTGLSLEI